MTRGPRRWIKVYCLETLHGSISYQLTEGERYVWLGLLCQAGLCGHEGVIADHDMKPWPHDHIARELNTTLALLESTLTKCKSGGRITEDGQGIKIINWTKYQSEYERQKSYRQRDRHLFVPQDRGSDFAGSMQDQHMDAWEKLHPGQKHPMRAAQEGVAHDLTSQ